MPNSFFMTGTASLANAKRNHEIGFTLIELMISIVLGLLIVAAVMQVYLVSSRTAVIQSSGSTIVDANIFGLQTIERKVKLANLGMANVSTATSQLGGIVVSLDNLNGIKLEGNTDIDLTLLSRSEGDTAGTQNQWTGASNTNHTSDQLTIQYRAPQNMNDCEGQRALGPRTVAIDGVDSLIDGQVIIERYFLRETDSGLALVCDAGRYITETMDDYTEQSRPNSADIPDIAKFDAPLIINDFGDAGSVVIPNIDDFQIMLGVMTATGVQYVSSPFYLDPANNINAEPIVALKIGILTRGSVPLPGNEEGMDTFTVLGTATELKDSASTNLIRKVYNSNIMLRNAREI